MALAQLLGRRQQIVDNVGNPLAGGLVYIYEPNTTNPVTSYQAADIVNPNTNPVKLSGSGRANIWVTRNVDVRITDKDGNLVVEELGVNPDDLGGQFDSGLVPNGSFETDADADNVPDGWTNDVSLPSSNNGLDSSQSTSGGQSWRTQSAGSGGGELVTTEFFPVNDADDLRIDFDLLSTVAAVRNIVRVEWYDISQISISDTDVYDSTANPLVFTSQVTLATPPVGARFAKLRILGGTTGGLVTGITYWDRLRVYYPTTSAGVFDNLTIGGNDLISTNTNGDINITPNGTGDTVVKNLAALTEAQLGFAGEVALEVYAANSVRIRSDIVTATPPAAELVTARLDFYDSDATDLLGTFGFIGAPDLEIRNAMEAGKIYVRGIDSGSVLRTMLTIDPETQKITVPQVNTPANPMLAFGDGDSGFYEAFDDDIRVAIAGATTWGFTDETMGNASLSRSQLYSLVPTGVIPGFLVRGSDKNTGIGGPADDQISVIAGGVEMIRAVETGLSTTDQVIIGPNGILGTLATPGLAFGDGDTGFYESADDTLIAVVGGEVAINMVFNQGVSLRYNNTVTLRTSNRAGADASSGAEVMLPDDTFYGVGINELPGVTISGSNHTYDGVDQGKSLDYDEATARSILLNNDASIPVGALSAYYVGPNAGVCTMQAGAGVTLEYFDGLAWQSTGAAGSITAGEGSGTIRKISDTNYRIAGPNLS